MLHAAGSMPRAVCCTLHWLAAHAARCVLHWQLLAAAAGGLSHCRRGHVPAFKGSAVRGLSASELGCHDTDEWPANLDVGEPQAVRLLSNIKEAP